MNMGKFQYSSPWTQNPVRTGTPHSRPESSLKLQSPERSPPLPLLLPLPAAGGGGEGGGGRLREAPPRSSILSFNKEIPTLGTRPVPFLVELSVLGTALLVSRNQPLAGASSEGRRQGSSAGFDTPKLGVGAKV